MPLLRVEDVFKISGVPTHTFVRPAEFNRLKVALRTRGRGLIVEGPSGIGKSTAITRALEELETTGEVVTLSARVPGDVEYIDMLPELGAFGTVIIDDFHRLDDAVKARIANLLKVTADAEDAGRKLVVIGINEAGKALIDEAPDVANRLELIKFEVEPPAKILELVEAGEAALNLSLAAKPQIVEKASGSFYVAQLLCFDACVQAGMTERPDEHQEVATPYTAIERRVVERQRQRFGDAVRGFARGTKFRPGGRAPYLHILRWLADSDAWSINVVDEMRKHATEKASVSVVVEAGYLARLCETPGISSLVHYNAKSRMLSVEDPMLAFYLRAINWPEFVREVGFTRVDYEEAFDVALSFAGEDRAFAEHLRDALQDEGLAVFYDLAEHHRFLGEDVEAYLGPIYASGSRYVVPILGELYGRKRWTLFEASRYKERIDKGQVLPVWSTRVPPQPTDRLRDKGGLDFDPTGDLVAQAGTIARVVARKLEEG